MKELVIFYTLLLSLTCFSAYSAEHGYWVEDSLCGEIDPFAIGDACVVEVANHKENFVIILELDFVIDQLDGEVPKGTTLILEKKGLKKATREVVQALDGFNKKLKVFKIDSNYVTFTHLSDEE